MDANGFDYNYGQRVVTITNTDLLSLDSTFDDLFKNAYAFAGVMGYSNYCKVPGTFKISNGDAKLRDYKGQNVLFSGVFIPDEDKIFETLTFMLSVTVPTE